MWFLLYLLFYAFVLAAVFAVVRPREMPEIPLVALVAVPGLWLCLTNVLIQEFSPVTMAFLDDWGNHLRWAGFFAAGVASARRTAFWNRLDASRRLLLALSIAGLGLQLVFSVYARRDAIDPAWYGTLYGVIGGLYGWAVVLTLIASPPAISTETRWGLTAPARRARVRSRDRDDVAEASGGQRSSTVLERRAWQSPSAELCSCTKGMMRLAGKSRIRFWGGENGKEEGAAPERSGAKILSANTARNEF